MAVFWMESAVAAAFSPLEVETRVLSTAWSVTEFESAETDISVCVEMIGI